MLSLCQFENIFFEQLKANRYSLAEQFNLGILKEEYLTIVKEIYKDKNKSCIKGRRAREFYDHLEGSAKEAMDQG